jgi:large subunit ribosomal protein L2
MALIKARPTSPGRRFQVKISRDHLHKGGPEESLVVHKNSTGARNHFGRQTVRHQGNGHKQKYRMVDFLRDKDGERRYIIAPKGVVAGDTVISGPESPIKPGNSMQLRNIPIGTTIHNVELKPGKGGQLARSAGGSAQLAAREGMYATVRLRSTETRKVHVDCRATIGEVSNDEHNLRSYGKAGAIRWRGIRPTVRGVVMNPVDHPHGGGEGKSGQGNPHPVSPWGWNTKGKKTRRNKRTAGMIIRRRN